MKQFWSKDAYNTKPLFLNGENTKFKIIVFKSLKEFRRFFLNNFVFPTFTGYLLRNVQGFASFFTDQDFDVVICNYNGLIINMEKEVTPASFTKPVKEAYLLYLFPPGTIKYLDLMTSETITPYPVILER